MGHGDIAARLAADWVIIEVCLEELINHLYIPDMIWQEMILHVQRSLPEEACGLAGGVFSGESGRVEIILPVVNQLHSPVRFRMDPAGQLAAFRTFEEQGLELIAIYHSHPNGPQIPSFSDMAEFYYPGVLSLVLSPQTGGFDWRVRAFHITSSQFHEVALTRLVSNNG
jgi:proteasome lid subunit RPN8/RPN11